MIKMSSKRSRKDGASSSVSKETYDKRKFVSEQAFEMYQLAIEKQKPWVAERGFDLYMTGPYERMMHNISRRQWQKLCAQPKSAVTPVVREFYANASVRHDFKSVVRGKEVSYSAEAINQYYGLPDYENNPYHSSESAWDVDEILSYISVPEGRWKTTEQAFSHKLPSKYTPTEQRAWHRFIGTKLLPTMNY